MANLIYKSKKDTGNLLKLKEELNSLIEKGTLEGTTITEVGYGPQTKALVKKLQQLLNENGITDQYGRKLTQDGLYGRKTVYAFRKFLKKTGKLETTPKLVKPKYSKVELTQKEFEYWHPPVLDGRISSKERLFDAVRPTYKTESGAVVRAHRHHGIDIHQKSGTPIFSAIRSEVFSLSESHGSGGNDITARTHIDGVVYFIEYMHLKEGSFRHLKKGEAIEPGDQIATIGQTGLGSRSAPHLHLSVRKEVSREEYLELQANQFSKNHLTTRTLRTYNGQIINDWEYKNLNAEERRRVKYENHYFVYIDPKQFLEKANEIHVAKHGKPALSFDNIALVKISKNWID
ncbi:M23 family metallopeptidase [Candidatus Micrarchaeota archaeon]|nr:M23 family metallopeptidase [Candidatus Micrarchaeota archaeon]